MMDKKEVAKILLEAKAVTLSPKKPYTFVSGIKSPIYCDNRLLISYPEKRKKIVEIYLEKLKDLDFDIVAGTATAGIPWASWIADKLNKPMIYIRGAKKDHGKENLIEGKLEQGQKAVIIEDLVSTGGSSFSAVQAARDAGAIVTHCITLFNYEMGKAKKTFEEGNCKLIELSNFSALAETAVEIDYIDSEEKGKILEWNKAPDEWGKKMGFE